MLLADTRPLGVLALASPAPADQARRTMGAAAALLSIAVRNAQLFADVRDRSVKDALTGCINRTHAFEILDAELARSRRAGTSVSIVLFDIDRFKGATACGLTCSECVARMAAWTKLAEGERKLVGRPGIEPGTP